MGNTLPLSIQPVPHEFSFGIEGMTCASCVARIEKTLRKLSGVVDVNVNLATERAIVVTGTGFDFDTMQRAVEQAGYRVVQQEINLDIEGMSCASCAGRVEKVLRKVGGVADAVVTLATERAHVRMAAGVQLDVLIAAIEQAGYHARVHRAQAAGESQRKGADKELLHVGIAALLSLPLMAPMLLELLGVHLMSPGWSLCWQRRSSSGSARVFIVQAGRR